MNAAGSKWNFLPFRPGLVGGHCIGVDPYYLTHKAQAVGYHPEIILAGRRLNDDMGAYVANQLIKSMIKRRVQIEGSRVLVLGFTFKENCPDIRNTRVVDVVSELSQYNCLIDVYDPWVDLLEATTEYGISPLENLPIKDGSIAGVYDAIILAVAHNEFRDMGVVAIRALGKPNHILYDLKYLFPAEDTDLRL